MVSVAMKSNFKAQISVQKQNFVSSLDFAFRFEINKTILTFNCPQRHRPRSLQQQGEGERGLQLVQLGGIKTAVSR